METLGSVTVLATDKTGTLTEGRMAVGRPSPPDGTRYAVTGTGYDPAGEVRRGDAGRRPAVLAGWPAAAAAVQRRRACRRPAADEPQWSAVGDPLEAALVTFAGPVRPGRRDADAGRLAAGRRAARSTGHRSG